MTNDKVSNPFLLSQLFDEARPILLAMDADGLVRPYIGRADVVDLTHGLLQAGAPYRSQLLQVFSSTVAANLDAAFDGFEAMALVYYQAELNAEVLWTDKVAEEFNDLTTAVDADDKLLTTWANAVFMDNALAMAEIKRIAPGHGCRDDAEDTTMLTHLFNKYGVVVGPITQEYLVAAEQRASRLIQLSTIHEENDPESPSSIRRRAFTRWLRTYNEILAAGRYMARNDPEALQKFVGPRSTITAKPKATATTAPVGQNDLAG